MNGRARLARAALALVILSPSLAGCDRGAERATVQDKGGPSADQVDAAYQACLGRADGDWRQLVACSQSAIASAAPDLTGNEIAALESASHAQAGGEGDAVRAAVADAMARLAIERAAVREGRPLPGAATLAVPSPLAAAGAPIVAGTCTGSPAVDACRAAHGRLLGRFAARLAGLSAPAEDSRPVVLGGYVPPSCEAVRAAASPDAALGEFESTFPAALKDERLVETVALDDAHLRAISAYLACLSARTDYAPDVVENSLTFFASKSNGARAREALAVLARGSGNDAAAAREFAAQVSDYLSGPEG
jgi:hypothetical protein